MKSLLLIISLFILAMIVSPLLPTMNNEFSFNYTITGCAETEEGVNTRDLTPDNVSPMTKINKQ